MCPNERNLSFIKGNLFLTNYFNWLAVTPYTEQQVLNHLKKFLFFDFLKKKEKDMLRISNIFVL